MINQFQPFSLKIPLFEGAEILVKEGEEVKQGQTIIKISQQPTIEVNLASVLKVKPVKVVSCLEVGPGREVKEGQVLAQKKRFFWKRKAFSPATGQVEGLAEDEGVLKIKTKGQTVAVRSPVAAKVGGLEKGFLVLQFPALVFSAKRSFGKSGWGELGDERKVALVGNLTLAVLNKLEALGAAGAVCQQTEGGIEKEIDEAGVLILSEKDFQKACQHNGKRAKVDVGDKRLIIAK